MNFKEYVLLNDLGDIKEDELFKNLTTIGCGGKIEYTYYPKDIESLSKAFAFINKNNIKYFILGNGSNVLAYDYNFIGVVIVVKKLSFNYKIENDLCIVSAFYPTTRLAYDLARENKGDLSFLGGIPGLVGGAIYNNSGAYNDNIGNHIKYVKYIDTDGKIVQISKTMCAFGYRSSIFHYISGIVIEAGINVIDIKTTTKLEKNKKDKMQAQPIESKSMGSVFKNNPLVPAWKIVDALHLRGFQIGDAAISSKHSNFIINLGNAKSSDILSLVELIQTRARLEFGINLYKEITIVE